MRRRSGVLVVVIVASVIQAPVASSQEIRPPAPSPLSRAYADYALIATEGMKLDAGTAVTGNVGVVEATFEPVFPASTVLRVDQSVSFAPHAQVAADSVWFADGVEVPALYANTVTSTLPDGVDAKPFATPLLIPVAAPESAPGIDPVTIGRDEDVTLAPAAYGSVLLQRGATLRLEAGTYQFADLVTGSDTSIVSEGDTTIVVAGAIVLGARNTVGTASHPIVIATHAAPADPTDPTAAPAFAVGRESTVTGAVLAPMGAAYVARDGSVAGTIQARWIQVGQDSVITAGSTPDDEAAPTAQFVRPSGDRPLFAVETIEIAAWDDIGVSAIEVVVDETSIGFARRSADGSFRLDWDTTTWSDGEHTLAALVTDAVDKTATVAIDVVVDNSLGAYDRLVADYEDGVISADDFIGDFFTIICCSDPLEDRYDVPPELPEAEGTTFVLSVIAEVWNELSTESRAAIEQIGTLEDAAPDQAFNATVEHASRRNSPGPSAAPNAQLATITQSSRWSKMQTTAPAGYVPPASVQEDCGSGPHRIRVGMFVRGHSEYFECVARFEHIDIYYNRQPIIANDTGGVYLVEAMADPAKIGPVIDQLGEAHDLAHDFYSGAGSLGYSLSERPRAVIHELAFGWAADGYTTKGFVQYDASDLSNGVTPYLPIHEAFHLFQWEFYSYADLARPANRILWWGEATAEWASGTVLRSKGISSSGYYDQLPSFLKETSDDIAAFETSGGQQYGAFIFAEYLAEAYDDELIRDIWDDVGDGLIPRTAPVAIRENVEARAQGTLAERLVEFWTATYELDYSPSDRPGDADEWRKKLPRGRPSTVPLDLSSSPLRLVEIIGPGGAVIWEADSQGEDGTVTITPNGLAVHALRYEKYPEGDEPARCSGEWHIEIPTGIETEIELTPDCPVLTIIAINGDIEEYVGTSLDIAWRPLPNADLEIELTTDAAEAPAGGIVDYSVNFRNLSGETVNQVEVAVELDPQTAVRSIDLDPRCSEASPTEVICEVTITLDPGSGIANPLQIPVGVADDATDSVAATATINGSDDPDPSNNTETVELPVRPVADLRIVAVTAQPDTLEPGSDYAFTIEVANDGPSDASDAGIFFGPLSYEFEAWAPTTPGCEIVFRFDGPFPQQWLECAVGSLSSGDTTSVSATATFPDDASVSEVTFTASTAWLASIDPDPANNFAELTLERVEPLADLTIDITIDPFPAQPGDRVAVTFTVTNLGPDTAVNTVLDARLPAQIMDLQVPSECTETVLIGQVFCSLGDLAPGEVVTIVVIGDIPPDADLTGAVITASATSDTTDPNPDLSLPTLRIVPGETFPLPCLFGCDAASSWGDPHLVTFDGLAYDLQTVGEFVLIESGDGAIVVQSRHQPWRGSTVVSVTTAVAARVGDHRVGIYLGGSVFVDGAEIELASGDSYGLGGGAAIIRSGGTYSIAWPGTDAQRPRLDVAVRSTSMNLTPVLPPSYRGQISGLLGNDNGNGADEYTTRAGVVLERPLTAQELYGPFAESWRIAQAESLFDYGPGEDTTTFTDLAFPSNVVTLADLDPADIAFAEGVCRAAGIVDPAILDACVLDLAITGDSTFVAGALNAQTPATAESGVYFDDFEDLDATGWSTTIVGTTEVGDRRFVGPLPAGSNTLSLTDLPPHTTVTVTYDLFVLGGWGGDAEGDAFAVSEAGAGTLIDVTLSNGSATQSFPAAGSAARSGAVEVDTLGVYDGGGSAVYRFEHTFDHWQGDLDVVFSAANISAADGEFWGVDNVGVVADVLSPEQFDYPGPGTAFSEAIDVPRGGDLVRFTVAGSLYLDWTQCFSGMGARLVTVEGEPLSELGCTDQFVDIPEGIYYLNVYSSGAGTGAYTFTLFAADGPSVFPYVPGSVVADGTPAAGAGLTEFPGNRDFYTFTTTETVQVFVDSIQEFYDYRYRVASATTGEAVIGTRYGDSAVVTIPPGDYRLEAFGLGTANGAYSFTLYVTDVTDFSYEPGTVVASNGADGSGRIEVPLTRDHYTFTTTETVQLFVDSIQEFHDYRYRVVDAATGTDVISTRYQDSAVVTIPPGDYRIEAFGLGTAAGAYSFALYVTDVERFDYVAGDPIGADIPAVGAGRIEVPLARDHYTFTAPLDGLLFVDSIQEFHDYRYRVVDAATGTVVISTRYQDSAVVSIAAGEYRLEAFGLGTANGAYAATVYVTGITEVPYTPGTVVSADGADGTGRIDVPLARDHYTFTTTETVQLFVDSIQEFHDYRYRVVDAATGTVVIDTRYQDSAVVTIPPGDYRLEAFGLGTANGAYSFALYTTEVTDFAYASGTVISDGVPGPGAGVIESPLARDHFTFTVDGEANLFVDSILEFFDYRYRVVDAATGVPVIATRYQDSATVTIAPGIYRLEVFGLGTAHGTYSAAVYMTLTGAQ